MPRNLQVLDVKPRLNQVADAKPQNLKTIDTKPQNVAIFTSFATEQLYTVSYAAGQPMGLLLALTYNTGGTVITNKSP